MDNQNNAREPWLGQLVDAVKMADPKEIATLLKIRDRLLEIETEYARLSPSLRQAIEQMHIEHHDLGHGIRFGAQAAEDIVTDIEKIQ